MPDNEPITPLRLPRQNPQPPSPPRRGEPGGEVADIPRHLQINKTK